MAHSAICPSCGHRQELPDGFSKRRIRCSECGVLCPVETPSPAGAASKKPGAPASTKTTDEDIDEMARQLWSEPDEPRAAPAKPPTSPSEPPASPAPEQSAPPNPSPAIVKTSRATWTDDDEDSSPYSLAGGPIRTCPECHVEIDRAAVLCVTCGYDFRKKTKVTKTFEPLEKHWHTGMPLEQRQRLFALSLLVGLIPAAAGMFFTGQWIALSLSFFVYAGMMAFLLGTFDRLHFVRDARGRSKITKTWRACFLERPPQTIDLALYSQLVTSRSRDAGFFEWFILLTLVPFFIIPAIVWYRTVIAVTQFQVDLARDHGYAEIVLYRGSDESQMRAIATTLRDAIGLRLD